MKPERYMDEEELIQRGVDALIRELGPVEAIRLLNMPRKKRMESVKRHRLWQKQLKRDEFFKEIFGH
jgi:hypothetical protein